MTGIALRSQGNLPLSGKGEKLARERGGARIRHGEGDGDEPSGTLRTPIPLLFIEVKDRKAMW